MIQVYGPTREVDMFYSDLREVIEKQPKIHQIVMGDFDAKLRKSKEPEDTYIGEYGYGERNEQGKQPLNFTYKQKFYMMNSFFPKRNNRKWT